MRFFAHARSVYFVVAFVASISLPLAAVASPQFLGDLTNDPSNPISGAAGINRSAQVVGSALTDFTDPFFGSEVYHAFLWTSAGGMIDLGSLAGPNGNSNASAINDAGVVVGSSFLPSDSPNTREIRPFRWTLDDGMQDLGSLPTKNGGYGSAQGINNSGQIVGVSGGHAFLYDNGTMLDLNDLIPEDSDWLLGTAYAINDAGWIVGTGTFNDQSRAFLYRAGAVTDLGTLGGFTFPRAINNLGQVVGSSELPNEFPPELHVPAKVHAFIWTENSGMVDALPGSAQYVHAYGINDAGQIPGSYQELGGDDQPRAVTLGTGGFGYPIAPSVATGINAYGVVVGVYENQAFIAPEPSTFVFSGVAIASLAVVAARRRRSHARSAAFPVTNGVETLTAGCRT
jgi:probable HAF family extracellular repeat protein